MLDCRAIPLSSGRGLRCVRWWSHLLLGSKPSSKKTIFSFCRFMLRGDQQQIFQEALMIQIRSLIQASGQGIFLLLRRIIYSTL